MCVCGGVYLEDLKKSLNETRKRPERLYLILSIGKQDKTKSKGEFFNI